RRKALRNACQRGQAVNALVLNENFPSARPFGRPLLGRSMPGAGSFCPLLGGQRSIGALPAEGLTPARPRDSDAPLRDGTPGRRREGQGPRPIFFTPPPATVAATIAFPTRTCSRRPKDCFTCADSVF